MSWTLSGADFYLISITNDTRTRLLNITDASVAQRELTGFQAGYEYTITVRGVNCGSQEGSESEPLTITPQGTYRPMYMYLVHWVHELILVARKSMMKRYQTRKLQSGLNRFCSFFSGASSISRDSIMMISQNSNI